MGQEGVVSPQMTCPHPTLPSRFLIQVPTHATEAAPASGHNMRPSGSTSFEEARQTGEIYVVYWAGEASFSSVRSLLMVVGFQEGCVMACGARKGPCRMGVGTGPQVMGAEEARLGMS